jgi:hypothetical protein
MLPDQSPSEFMLSVLSDPAVAEEAADQWAAAHPAAAAADQGGTAGGGGAGVANGQPKDLGGGSASGAPHGRDAAATLVPRRRALQNSVSLVGLPQGEQHGDSKLALLAMQVSVRPTQLGGMGARRGLRPKAGATSIAHSS